MNQRQREVLKKSLKDESRVLKELEKAYAAASRTIEERIRQLLMKNPGMQSRIYQRRYQETVKKTVDGVLDRLRKREYKTLSDYLDSCYENGFLGTVYDMQGQGIPLLFPVDPDLMYRAVTLNSRLSSRLYTRLGFDVRKLKNDVRGEISRGIASGWSIDDMAAAINRKQSIGLNNAKRIARTEARRIQNEASYDAQLKAAENGAEVIKEWCAILDSRTREDHRTLHGQRKELDEYFEVNGHRALHPSGFGVASEDINCRCVLLTRARWAVEDEEEIIRQYDQENGVVTEVPVENFDSFKKTYYEKADFIKTYTRYRNQLGTALGMSFDELYALSDSSDWGLFEYYAKSMKRNEMLSSTTFQVFRDTLKAAEKELIGLVTYDGVEIKSVAVHFAVRLIGNEKDHIPVSLADVIDTLEHATDIKYTEDDRGDTKTYRAAVNVTINAENGRLVQCNSRGQRR